MTCRTRATLIGKPWGLGRDTHKRWSWRHGPIKSVHLFPLARWTLIIVTNSFKCLCAYWGYSSNVMELHTYSGLFDKKVCMCFTDTHGGKTSLYLKIQRNKIILFLETFKLLLPDVLRTLVLMGLIQVLFYHFEMNRTDHVETITAIWKVHQLDNSLDGHNQERN